MEVTQYIEKFAQALVDFINMVKNFFAQLGGTTNPEA